jgi:hypothetical protein
MDETRSDRSVLKDVIRNIAAKEGFEDTPRFRIFAEDTSAPLLKLLEGRWIVLAAAVWSTYTLTQWQLRQNLCRGFHQRSALEFAYLAALRKSRLCLAVSMSNRTSTA